MSNLQRTVELVHFTFDQLTKADQELVQSAAQAMEGSYSPYSNFAVGSAVRLRNGVITKGANQENAAYPSGLCAERTALFHVGSNFPNEVIESIAVTVSGGATDFAYPCGSCLQVIAEYEAKQSQPIDIILVHPLQQEVLVSKGVSNLLPFAFNKKHLRK